MSELAKQLLSEKLLDDFYEDDHKHTAAKDETILDPLTEQLKSAIPVEAHSLLLRWEANCSEMYGEELRRFSRFVANVILEESEQLDDSQPTE